MNVSPYTLVHPDPDGGAWLVNSLHGRWLRLGPGEWQLLGAGAGADGGQAALVQRLAEARILEPAAGHDQGVYGALVELADQARAWRLGYLLDYLTPAEIAATPGYAAEQLGLPDPPPGKLMVYGWYFTPAGRERLADLAAALGRLPRGQEGRYVALHTDGNLPLGDADLAALEGLGLTRGSGMVVFILSREAALAAGGAAPYCQQIFAQQGQLYGLGFLPFFLFRCTAETAGFMTGPLFEALCFSGIYPRNLFFSFSRPPRHPLDLACELYGWDWDLYRAAGLQLALSAQHQVVEPLGRGMADKLRVLFRDGGESPDLAHCPFVRRSFIFGPGGLVAPCPVAHGPLLAGDPAYQSLRTGHLAAGEVWPAAQAHWEGRHPGGIARCGTCPVAPLCGSGCPLTALEETGDLYGTPCPPAHSVLAQEVAVARERGR